MAQEGGARGAGQAAVIRDRSDLTPNPGPLAYIAAELLAHATWTGRHSGLDWIEVEDGGRLYLLKVTLHPEQGRPLIYLLDLYEMDPITYLAPIRWPD